MYKWKRKKNVGTFRNNISASVFYCSYKLQCKLYFKLLHRYTTQNIMVFKEIRGTRKQDTKFSGISNYRNCSAILI
jgi:hypothetical protein